MRPPEFARAKRRSSVQRDGSTRSKRVRPLFQSPPLYAGRRRRRCQWASQQKDAFPPPQKSGRANRVNSFPQAMRPQLQRHPRQSSSDHLQHGNRGSGTPPLPPSPGLHPIALLPVHQADAPSHHEDRESEYDCNRRTPASRESHLLKSNRSCIIDSAYRGSFLPIGWNGQDLILK